MPSKNPDKTRVTKAADHARHRDSRLASMKAWYDANREKRRASKRAYYLAHRDEVLAQTADQRAAYRATEQGRTVAAAAVQRYGERNPEKARAHKAVNHAVERGLLVKQPCEVCGDPAVHGHHAFGYSDDMKLAVWWLCPKHHGGMHRFIRDHDGDAGVYVPRTGLTPRTADLNAGK